MTSSPHLYTAQAVASSTFTPWFPMEVLNEKKKMKGKTCQLGLSLSFRRGGPCWRGRYGLPRRSSTTGNRVSCSVTCRRREVAQRSPHSSLRKSFSSFFTTRKSSVSPPRNVCGLPCSKANAMPVVPQWVANCNVIKAVNALSESRRAR